MTKQKDDAVVEIESDPPDELETVAQSVHYEPDKDIPDPNWASNLQIMPNPPLKGGAPMDELSLLNLKVIKAYKGHTASTGVSFRSKII